MILLDNQAIRQRVLARRMQMSQQEVAEKSARIVAKCLPYCVPNAHIALYLPIQNEVDLRSLLEQAPTCQFYVPCIDDGTTMHFVRWQGKEAMQTNAFGILEPKQQICIAPEALDVIFVPLVAFHTKGGRLGHGKGYYDRYLKQCSARKIAVAYEFQHWENLQQFSHDVLMDLILTESNCYTQTQK